MLLSFFSGKKKVGRRGAHPEDMAAAIPKADDHAVSAMTAKTAFQEWLEGVTAAVQEAPVEERPAILKRMEAACRASQELNKLEAIRNMCRQLDLKEEPPPSAASPLI